MDIFGNGTKAYSANRPFANSNQPVLAFDNLGVANPYLKGKMFNHNDTVKELLRSQPNESYDRIVFSSPDEQMPSFPGGNVAMLDWKRTNLVYPPQAEVNNIQGRVVVTFVVEADGRLTGVRALKLVDPLLDEEAVRLVKSMPRWVLGKRNCVPVRVRNTIPVTFRLAQ